MVKRLRLRPLTPATGVRIPMESPNDDPIYRVVNFLFYTYILNISFRCFNNFIGVKISNVRKHLKNTIHSKVYNILIEKSPPFGRTVFYVYFNQSLYYEKFI